MIKKLRQGYQSYEKYLIWLILTLCFSAILMWLAKQIFEIYLPFTTWKVFLETIGILAFLFSIFTAWATWRTDKKQQELLSAARKEEQIFATLEKHSLILARVEGLEDNLRGAIINCTNIVTANARAIDDTQNQIGRLSAQVQQTEAEAVLIHKISRIEKRLLKLDKQKEEETISASNLDL